MIPRPQRLESTDAEWEPIPWDAPEHTAEEMYAGYAERAAKPIHWQQVPFLDFPEEGLLGHGREWFARHDIACFSAADGEDLLLIDSIWSGWPDPPRWGLASRPSGSAESRWRMWGYFRDVPPTWTVPEQKKPNAQD
jgi:hypothetical protein